MRLFPVFTFLTVFAVLSCTPSHGPLPPAPPTQAPKQTASPVDQPVDTPAQPAAAPAQAARTAQLRDILVLGDSQISFGAGGAYRRFFSDPAASCRGEGLDPAPVAAAAIGVRSTALHNWTATAGPARGVICDVDPKFGVNAGSYGVTSPGLTYIQIGKDAGYPFCASGKSPLQSVFETSAYDPDLVVLSFLGNATDRWQSPQTARSDWQATRALLPAKTACLVMTTIPAYMPEVNRRRMTAQNNLAAAVRADGRCAFVAGITQATIAEFEGNKSHFRTRPDGTVRDPRHPTASSATRFTEMQTPALCAALARIINN